MFHGIKKKDVKKMTPEEEKKNEETLVKIKAIQNKIIELKKENKYSEESMKFLYGSAILMPDYPTLWTIRKKLIEQYLKENTPEKSREFLIQEIKGLKKLLEKDTKSYLLWYHRIWCIVHTVEIEKQQNVPVDKSYLMQEVGLCDAFLGADGRNFHCWNYRIQLFTLVSKYYQETFSSFVKKEIDFAIRKIKKDFSNFSAWHYKSKLIPIYFIQIGIKWNTREALDYFKEDLELLKNAFYTDPKDQSPWNYHFWIVNNFSPIYVKAITVNSNERIVLIKYSNVFRVRDLIDESAFENKCTIVTKEEFSSELKIKINENVFGDILIVNKVMNQLMPSLEHLSLINNKICFNKQNISLPKVILSVKEEITYQIQMNNYQQFQIDFLKEQIALIDELITKSTDFFIENAHYRKAQIYHLFYEIYIRLDNKDLAEENLKKEIEQYQFLKEKSKRMTKMYSSLLSSCNKEL